MSLRVSGQAERLTARRRLREGERSGERSLTTSPVQRAAMSVPSRVPRMDTSKKVRESSSQAGEEKMIHDMEEELQEEKEAGGANADETVINPVESRAPEDDSEEQIEKLIERALSDAGELTEED